jgi:hypothetical protein
MESAASSIRSLSLEHSASFTPSLARASATALPKPLLEAVTTATLPLIFNSIKHLLFFTTDNIKKNQKIFQPFFKERLFKYSPVLTLHECMSA